MPKGQKTKASDWIPIIKTWKKSGLTKKQFCQQNNLSTKTFYRWHHQLQKPEPSITLSDKSKALSLANFIPVTVNPPAKKIIRSEQHCILLLNDKLQLQIPIDVITADFLDMLMATAGANPC